VDGHDSGTRGIRIMKICQVCAARFRSAAWSCPSCSWQAPRYRTINILSSVPSVPGFAPQFFDLLSAPEERHFWFRARNALIAEAIGRHFPQARTFLEVGCGTAQVTGALQRACPALSYTASEVLREGLLVAERKAPGAELVQADVHDLPWEDEFDIVGAFDVLEHVADHGAAARQLARVVKPGGGVIVTVPQHQWLWSPIDDYACHQRRYSRTALVTLLAQAGLRVERVTSFVSLLLPLLIASRLAQRRGPVDPQREFQLSRLGNWVGDKMMTVERALIGAGISFPVGGSLLAIARRSDEAGR
jgi:SAM-dependent methyltransferase